MKKSPLYLLGAVLATMTLAGCGNDNIQETEPDEIVIQDYPDFTATIAGDQSRAEGTAWDRGDKIGITGAGRTNVSYVTDAGDGRFGVEDTGKQIYFQDENPVTFTAYYPWTNLAEGAVTISADTKSQSVSAQKSFDFLWAQGTGRKAAPIVELPFAHKMAKVSFTVRPGDGMSFEEVKQAALSLGGLTHTGTFNVTTGRVAVTGNATDKWVFTGGVAPVAVNEAAKTLSFSFILLPQDLGAPLQFEAELDLPGDREYHLTADIDFTSANRVKDGNSAKNEWVAGRQYNLSLTLHKTDVTVDGNKINPWTEVVGEDIDVN